MSKVLFKDRAGNDLVLTSVEYVPKVWSAKNIGGFDKATIEAFGPKEKLLELAVLLKYQADIYNDFGKHVWNGFVNEIIIYFGSVSIGFSLSEMANKIKVIYNTTTPTNGSYSSYTDWIEDDVSIGKYGYFERVLSYSDGTDTTANAFGNQYLSTHKQPIQSLAFDQSSELAYARIECLGWYSTLAWRLFKEDRGKEFHNASGSYYQSLGVGLTSSKIGFNIVNEVNQIEVVDSNAMEAFTKDDKIRITGSASNNGLFTVDKSLSREHQVYNTDASFSSDDIFDANEDMTSYFDVGDLMLVTNSASNNGYYFLTNVIPEKVETDPNILTTEAENPVTLEAGSGFTVVEAITQEIPSYASPYNVTIRGQVQKLSREFTAVVVGTWKVDSILLRVQKVGSPSDDLKVSLMTNAGSHTYSTIEYATVAGSSISETNNWITFQFDGTNTITGGNDYAIVIERTGSFSTDDYYKIQLDDDSSESGIVFVNDSTGWVAHPLDYDMPFQVIGIEETTTELDVILSEVANDFNYYIEIDSGVDDLLFMSNYEIAKNKVERLLSLGDISGKSLVAVSDLNKNIYIRSRQEGTDSAKNFSMDLSGNIKTGLGEAISDGQLIFDSWLEVDVSFASFIYSANLSKIYVYGSEWDDSNKTLKIISSENSSIDKLEAIFNG